MEHLADDNTRHDPADGAQHPDGGELLRRILDVVERNRVAERQGGHVAEGVQDQHRVEAAELGQGGDIPQDHPAQQVEDAEQLLGMKEAVGHHPDEEG